MKKLVIVFLLSVAIFLAFGPKAQAQIAKEGSFSNVVSWSGTMKTLPMGQERLHMSYEVLGAVIGDTGDDLFHNSSMHCLGGFDAVKGEYNNDSGFCTYTRPDGDQFFMTNKVAGKLGSPGKGVMTFVGGTGKLAGIQGSCEFTRTTVRSSAPGTIQGYNRAKWQYKLP